MEHSGDIYSADGPQTRSDWRHSLVFLQLNTYFFHASSSG
jgi:hypothetical protein